MIIYLRWVCGQNPEVLECLDPTKHLRFLFSSLNCHVLNPQSIELGLQVQY